MILVVDDHADSCDALVLLLRTNGYSAAAVGDGRLALDVMRHIKPRLVVLDGETPCGEGLEVLRAMRGDASLADVPVIMFSAGGSPAVGDQADRLRVRGWVARGGAEWEHLLEFAEIYAR